MIGKHKDKMISNESHRDFHFSGAGSNLPPVLIKARTVEEAEAKWREMNEAAAPTGSYERGGGTWTGTGILSKDEENL